MANVEHKTRWVVLTGAPCSGKTAVIEVLSRRGYPVIHETARAHMEAELARGHSLERILSDRLLFERSILLQKVAIERDLDPDRLIFFDRGIPDSIAYYRLSGLDPSEPIAFSRETRYARVFLFDRLSIVEDNIRKERDETAADIERLLAECYGESGYPLVRIPVRGVAERADEILKHLE